jgi:hypothetical protein
MYSFTPPQTQNEFITPLSLSLSLFNWIYHYMQLFIIYIYINFVSVYRNGFWFLQWYLGISQRCMVVGMTKNKNTILLKIRPNVFKLALMASIFSEGNKSQSCMFLLTLGKHKEYKKQKIIIRDDEV